MQEYDVIVVGGGHAGCEAAHAAARVGLRTLLLTLRPDTIAQMSCNPAIGGLGKSQLVSEIDALGGLMADVIDHTGIQFRMLNTRKGPAVQALRAQADRHVYAQTMRGRLEATPGLDIKQGMAVDVLVDATGVTGVVLTDGARLPGRTVVLTTGTFLNGLLHTGTDMRPGGRVGEEPAVGLTDALRRHGVSVGRLKTGTPPRLDGRTIDYARMQMQPGDDNPPAFSFRHRHPPALAHAAQVPCHITRTTIETKRIIEANIGLAPLFSGQITSTGPRYCPSIEDKVSRFADKDTHHVFIEPEGRLTTDVYPNGISTSLPYDVQEALVHSVIGLEHAKIVQPGYAIEYDYCDPIGLLPTLESKAVPGLFLAGQINGTSGYEEAGAQGILAGINAAARCKGAAPLMLDRSEAYLAVMVDDLVTRGTTEPYRMFTSRAEYRLLLRQDNADMRLMEYGRQRGLVDDARYEAFCRKRDGVAGALAWIEGQRRGTGTLLQQLSGPATTAEDVRRVLADKSDKSDLSDLSDLSDIVGQILVECKYAGYIGRQLMQVARFRKMEQKRLPHDIDYGAMPGMRTEARKKFEQVRPQSLGQAGRIEGITPADVALVWHHVARRAGTTSSPTAK